MKTAELLSGTDGAYLFHYFTKDEFKTLTIYVSEYQSGTLISKSKVADLDYDESIPLPEASLLLCRILNLLR